MFGNIGDPELIRTGCGEVTLHQVTGRSHRNEVPLPATTLRQTTQLQLLHD
jgi:hypothetical protein